MENEQYRWAILCEVSNKQVAASSTSVHRITEFCDSHGVPVCSVIYNTDAMLWMKIEVAGYAYKNHATVQFLN